jgi:hypothetical protein
MLKTVIKSYFFIFTIALLLGGIIMCVVGTNNIIVASKKDNIQDRGAMEFFLNGNVYKTEDNEFEFKAKKSSADTVTKRVYTYNKQEFIVDEDQDLSTFVDKIDTEGKIIAGVGAVLIILALIFNGKIRKSLKAQKE